MAKAIKHIKAGLLHIIAFKWCEQPGGDWKCGSRCSKT